MKEGACLKTPVKCSQRQLNWCWCWCCYYCILGLRFYDRAVMLLCLTLVSYRQPMLYCEGGPFTDSFAVHVVAVSSQSCIVVVSCCALFMLEQLLYWFGCWL